MADDKKHVNGFLHLSFDCAFGKHLAHILHFFGTVVKGFFQLSGIFFFARQLNLKTLYNNNLQHNLSWPTGDNWLQRRHF
jgi:hypothetical protein